MRNPIHPILMILALSATALAADAPVAPIPADLKGEDLLVVTNRDSNDLTLIDWRKETIVGRRRLGCVCNPHMAMLTPDGKTLVTMGTALDKIFVMDVAGDAPAREITVGSRPEHFDISADSRTAFVNNFKEGTLSVIDLKECREVSRIPGFSEPHNVTFTPDGKKAYVANLGAHEVGIVDLQQRKLVGRLAIGSAGRQSKLEDDKSLDAINGIINVTLTPDGKWGYAADGDSGQVAIIDTEKDEVVATLKVGGAPWRAYASPDGKWMLIPNNGDETVSVIDAKTRKVVATLPAFGWMTGINFGPEGKKAYVIGTGETGAIMVYDLEAMKLVTRIKIGGRLALETAATSPDHAKIFLTSSTDNSVYVISTATDTMRKIENVGVSPWASFILGGENYCH